MKTTVEIPDDLLREAKRLAAEEGTTVRALVEQGLRTVIAARRAGGTFRLRRVTFRGHGLRPEAAAHGWGRIRELIYEGRGG